ncbi:MAG TPA: aminoacyl-tRNA hydrolase [Candidatus Marinimicrobia bacterium]|nr:MAG: aminoacyl-tRNA hydrolase [Candidatus Marinimicrobia bacterium CG_4_10_14_0_2_um_filter_48_9]PJA54218.1 MAG: aminoacyl-tRNA hydrolase [Candidatus Marinimicrobia bacterium CG_4_9_14_3_um_filter_48_9]HCW77002.1 aminoacyl-tRNA hydrolase [Candidatus Neomarinimicrobiota bacterium]
MALKLIIGLGNPGTRYAKTRHNVGFMVVDQLAQRWNLDYRSGRGPYVYAKDGTRDAILAKPTTYMNNSGEAARHLMDYYGCELMDTMIIFDELDIPFNQLRLRKSGGGGTHRGIRSVLQHLGSEDFPRLRIGIGGNQGPKPAEVYVLENFEAAETKLLPQMIERAADAVEDWLKNGLDHAMNQFNQTNQTDDDVVAIKEDR